MQLLPMASSPDGLISARYAVITKTPGWEVLTTTSNVNVTQGQGGGGSSSLYAERAYFWWLPQSSELMGTEKAAICVESPCFLKRAVVCNEF